MRSDRRLDRWDTGTHAVCPIVPEARLAREPISRPPIGVNEGNGMGYLKLLILVLAYALITPALAQSCCPAGCAPEADRCVTTGPLWTRCIPSPAPTVLESRPATPP